MTDHSLSAHIVFAAAPVMKKINSTRVSFAAKLVQPRVFNLPIGSSKHTTHHSISFVDILLSSCNKIVGKRFCDLFSLKPKAINLGKFSRGDALQNSP